MTAWLRDLSYGMRSLRRQPAFAAVACITIALGVGGSTAIFSVLHAVLLRPLPYADEANVVMVWETDASAGVDKQVGTPGNFQDWRDQNRTIDHLGALMESDATLTGRGDARRVDGRRVNASVFTALGVTAHLGRTFTAADEQPGARVVILAHHTWQQVFGGDPAVIGQSVVLNDEPWTIVGVMGPSFLMPRGPDDVWVPMVFSEFERQARGSHRLIAIGRLKPGVTLQQSQADMDVIARGLAERFPRFNAREGLLVEPIREELSGGMRRPLTLLMAAVLIVMLIACINVANLLLARACERRQEMAVRLAMGARRAHLARQLMTESVLLSLFGCLGGVGLASAAVGFVPSAVPASLANTALITVNAPILAFAIGLALCSGVLFGLAPVIAVSRRDGSAAVFDAPRGATAGAGVTRTKQILVAAEIAMAVVLLAGGVLLTRSFLRLMDVPPGFRTDSALTFTIEIPRSRYPGPARWAPMLDALMARLESVPSVTAAGAISWLPLTTGGGSNALFVEGRPLPGPGEDVYVFYRLVTPGYFQALSIPLIAGRPIDARDGVAAPRVVVINQTMADRYWPDESPLGKRVTFARAAGPDDWMTVVGVVGDTRQGALNEAIDIEMFAPHTQEANWFPPSDVAVRTSGDPLAVAAAVRAAVREVDALIPVTDMKTLEAVVAQSVAPARFNTAVLSAFAGVALVLAAVGVYGLLSFAVASRTREIGVRTALGADPRAILRMVMRDGLRIVMLGLAAGLPLAFAAGRLLQSFLFETSPADAVTFASIVAVLVIVAMAACYVPARRAASIDPVDAMRI